MCLDYCVAKIYECGIIKIERQPQTRWVAGFIVKRKSTLLLASCSDPKKLDFYYAAEFRICCVFFMQQN